MDCYILLSFFSHQSLMMIQRSDLLLMHLVQYIAHILSFLKIHNCFNILLTCGAVCCYFSSFVHRQETPGMTSHVNIPGAFLNKCSVWCFLRYLFVMWLNWAGFLSAWTLHFIHQPPKMLGKNTCYAPKWIKKSFKLIIQKKYSFICWSLFIVEYYFQSKY